MVPDDILQLSEELEALGGGDTRIGDATVFCRIRPPAEDEASIVSVGYGRSHILVRDPRCPPNVPTQQAVRRYRVSNGGASDCTVGSDASQEALFDSLGRSAFDW